MKKLRKHLSLVLALTVLLSMAALTTTVSADPTALLELDFSNFSAVPYGTADEAGLTTKTSGVTATGALSSTTTLCFSKRNSENKLEQGDLHNAEDGHTFYIELIEDSSTYNWTQHLNNIQFKNNDLESASNTFSFWIDAERYAASRGWKQVFMYRVDYNDGSASTTQSFDLGINTDGKWAALNAPTSAETISNGTIPFTIPSNTETFTAPTGWKHVVITNPKRSSNGQKLMSLYINGEHIKDVTLNIPDNANITSASCAFFSKSDPSATHNGTDPWWRTREAVMPHGMLADVKVYDGELSAQEVSGLYTAQLPRFQEYVSQLPDIEGYTFEDASFEYDGDSHNIFVTEGAGATQDVEKAYTCNGMAFSGATAVGSYPITATLTKTGYNDLVLNATLYITKYGSKLVDLDLSTYVKDTTTDSRYTDASIGGVTNNGSLADTTRVVMSSFARYNGNYLDLNSMENVKGETTYWLDYTSDNNANVMDVNRFRFIDEPALETRANTISFWIKYDASKNRPTDRHMNIVDYNVNGTEKFMLRTDYNENGKFKLTDAWIGNWYSDQNKSNDKWINIVITNPAYVGGEKVMTTYVDGVKLGETTVTQTENVTSAKFAIGGTVIENLNGYGIRWPLAYSFGEIAVYDGAFTESEIAALYIQNAYKFISSDLTVQNSSDEVITSISGIADNDTIKVGYDFSLAGIQLFVAAYSADGTLLGVNTVAANGAGTLSLSVPAEASEVKVYTWQNSGTYFNPIRDVITLIR